MRATNGSPRLFPVVEAAFPRAGIHYQTNDPTAILIWFDGVYKQRVFEVLRPLQVINRIPGMELICCKSVLVRLIQQISPLFPDLYAFIPRSWVLSKQKNHFLKQFVKRDRSYIVKPDNGSLGIGIRVFHPTPETHFDWGSIRAVAQEYIDSYVLDRRKFDFRIYVLIASISPLQIYVYREGIARFCSEDVGIKSDFAQLTNTAVNRGHASGITSILKMLTEVFERLREAGIDVARVWREIDAAIVLTILAGYYELERAEASSCAPAAYPRCFHVVGFDVMLDKNAKPAVIEVNYRPSLEVDDSECEGPLKIAMLADAMRIAVPLPEVQTGPSLTPDFQARFWAARRAAAAAGRFECIFDSGCDGWDEWKKVMKSVQRIGPYEKTGWETASNYFCLRTTGGGRLAITTNSSSLS
jgi:hypothetical protein